MPDRSAEASILPGITVVTATCNSLQGLQATAAALCSQSLPPTQWLVADGNSSDGTIEFLRALERPWIKWNSRPDHGVYDAWNRVLPHATAEWVLFLGAGDILRSNNTLQFAAERLRALPDSTDLAYGDVVFLDPQDGKDIYSFGGPWSTMDRRWKWGLPMLPMHPGIFHRRRILALPSPFDASFRIAADNLLLLTHLRRKAPHYLEMDVTGMPLDGMSARIGNTRLIDHEFRRIRKTLGLRPPLAHWLEHRIKLGCKYLLADLFSEPSAARILDVIQAMRGKPRRFRAASGRK